MAGPRDPIERSVGWRLALARAALLWEAAWPLFWPIPALVALFVALALFDLLPRLPSWLHVAVLAAFAIAVIRFVPRLFRLKLPSADAARRRLERTSGLDNGPLEALADEVAAGRDDPVALALWEAHRRRLARVIGRVRAAWPAPVLARHDPLGLRFAALLLLAVALAGGWHGAPTRLARAVTPGMDWLLGPEPTLQVWITPPEYTHVAPLLLGSLPAGEAVRVPAGSKLLAELAGGRGDARLKLGGDERKFERLDATSQRIEAVIAGDGELVVRQGWRRVAGWTIAAVADQPPTIEFAVPPDADPRGRLRFDVVAGDDYGVAKAWVQVRRPGDDRAAPVTVALPISGHPKHVRQASWHDLTSSPWAGLPVVVTPQAVDDAGQQASGAPQIITLPERIFRHPVARAIIALRKALAADPDARAPVIDGLADIEAAPDSWGGDIIVALALSMSRARLTYDQEPDAIPSVIDTLWQTALRLEEGDRPVAERAVDEATQALEKALADNAPQSEIDRLTAELQSAIARLLQAMVQQALKNGEPPLASPGQQTVSPSDLRQMLDQMRNQSRTGSRDAARQTLDQLRQLLDSLRAGQPSMANRQQSEQARRAADALQAIARDQQSLLDDTFHRGQQSDRRPQPDQQGAGTQENIRHRLGDAMQALGDLGADIPDALGEAEQAMRDSSNALNKGDLAGAVDAETKALGKLREGMKSADQELAQRFGTNGIVRGPGRGPGEGDPLGRPLNGANNADDEAVKIPTEADMQKAREVLDELRRRSGDAHRPTAERDYLQRLLRQFF